MEKLILGSYQRVKEPYFTFVQVYRTLNGRTDEDNGTEPGGVENESGRTEQRQGVLRFK